MIRGTVYHAQRTSRGPAVLMLHGFSGTRAESGFMFVQMARQLADAGVTAVTFDFLHSSESDGSFDQMLATGELADALHMTGWLKAQMFADRTRLGLIGFSLGGLLAACVCGRTDAYRALVLIAPTTPENLCRHAADASPEESAVYGPHALNPQLFDDVMTLDPLADVVKHPRPTLLIQGSGDKAVTPQVSGRFVAAILQASPPIDVVEVAGADHAFSHPDWRQQLNAAVAPWMAQQLGT